MLPGEGVLLNFQLMVMTFRPRQAPRVGLFSVLRRAVPAHGASGRSRLFRNGIFQVPV